MLYNFVNIEGNIGAGKTSLAQMLARDFNGNLVLEQFADNPFLPAFYKNPKQNAFPLELFFLAERYGQLKQQVQPSLFSRFTVSDYIFIKSLLFARVNLEEQEYGLYQRLFNIIYEALPQPDLLIYLHAPIPQLMENIQLRGRAYEQDITHSYLLRIEQTYLEYLKQQTTGRIVLLDITGADFVNNVNQYNTITQLLSKPMDMGIHRISLAGIEGTV